MKEALAVMLGLGLALGVSACGGSSTGTQTHLRPTSTKSVKSPVASIDPATTATPSPMADGTAQALETQAVAMVGPYYAALDAVYDSKTLPLDALYNVAVPPAVLTLLATEQRDRAQGFLSSGATKVVTAMATVVDTTFSAAAKQYPYVKVQTCIDTSGLKTMQNGKPFAKTGTNLFSETLTFTNPSYPAATGWKVSHFTASDVKSCT